MIISIHAEKAFDKIQHPFHDEKSQKTRYRGEPPQLDKEELPYCKSTIPQL